MIFLYVAGIYIFRIQSPIEVVSRYGYELKMRLHITILYESLFTLSHGPPFFTWSTNFVLRLPFVLPRYQYWDTCILISVNQMAFLCVIDFNHLFFPIFFWIPLISCHICPSYINTYYPSYVWSTYQMFPDNLPGSNNPMDQCFAPDTFRRQIVRHQVVNWLYFVVSLSNVWSVLLCEILH